MSAQLGDRREQIASVVLVGGDDIIPLAPVAQHTGQFNEASHAPDLRLRTRRRRMSRARRSSPTATLDPCATPLSAAAATNHILTDDPYGLADAYESLGGLPLRADRGRGPAVEIARADHRGDRPVRGEPTASWRPTRPSPAATARGANCRSW